MSRIVVVEPHKMLQQAFVAALFPEHQVSVSETIPDATADADIVIVDAAAMRRRGRLSAREVKEVQAWKVPLIWIDDEAASNGAPVASAIRLSAPVARDDLRAAAAQCVREIFAPLPAPAAKASRSVARLAEKTDPIESEPPNAAPSDKKFIELVDVIEETPELGERGAEAGNKH
jgi:hypothetical protein